MPKQPIKRITIGAMLDLRERHGVDLLAPDEALMHLEHARTLRRVLWRCLHFRANWGLPYLLECLKHSFPIVEHGEGKKATVEAAAVEPWQILFETAGQIGTDPLRLTVRELFYMAKGKGLHDWNQTASILASTYNTHRARGSQKSPDDFNPYTSNKSARPVSLQSLRDLKEVLPHG